MSATRWRRGGRIYTFSKVVESLWDARAGVKVVIEGPNEDDVIKATQSIFSALLLMSKCEDTLRNL